MTATKWECDVCEEPRYSSQMLRCNVCASDGNATERFVGYCCADRHAEDKHANYDGTELYAKLNHAERTRDGLDENVRDMKINHLSRQELSFQRSPKPGQQKG